MKKLTLLAFAFCASNFLFAQNIGIGTSSPDASAQLDITSTGKGLLLPRMGTSAIMAIANPAKGLLVYDTSKNQLMVNMGSSNSPDWQTIVSKSGWGLNGNSGTNSANHFIGTTDSIPFVIKAFNQKAGRIDVSEFGNTFFGYQSGNANTVAAANTAMGFRALRLNTGTQNTAFGYDALAGNISGALNVASGYLALASNTSGDKNVAIGTQALNGNTTGNNNTAVGYWALPGNQAGYANVAIGSNALSVSSNRSNLVAIGDSALYWNGDGAIQAFEADRNTAVGAKALFNNTSGYLQTATGFRSMYYNTSGKVNSAYGSFSMEDNTTGSDNNAFGYSSLGNNTTGNENTAIGAFSMNASTTGSFNTACGTLSMSLNQGGSFNTGIGYLALHFNRHAQYNTAVGYRAGDSYDVGWNNTIIGADADVSFNGQYNTIVIGNVATGTDNSKVRIGNSSNWSYEAFANWTNISDGRFKTNIRENVAGLNFIMKLRPVTYQMDVNALSVKFNEARNGTNDESMKKAIYEKEQMVWTGFVAQEVESAANESNFLFSGVDKPRNEYGVYGLRYAEFVVPLVKAVQEQQKMIEDLRKENVTIMELKQENVELKTRLEQLEKLIIKK